MNQIRINKFLSQQGVASRREAENLIIAKKVLINGQIATLGQKVGPNDLIKVNGKIIS